MIIQFDSTEINVTHEIRAGISGGGMISLDVRSGGAERFSIYLHTGCDGEPSLARFVGDKPGHGSSDFNERVTARCPH